MRQSFLLAVYIYLVAGRFVKTASVVEQERERYIGKRERRKEERD